MVYCSKFILLELLLEVLWLHMNKFYGIERILCIAKDWHFENAFLCRFPMSLCVFKEPLIALPVPGT